MKTLHQLKEAKRAGRGQSTRASKQRLYNYRWAQYSKQYRVEHPLCVECDRQGKTTPSEVVDHITPHNGNMRLFWAASNHQPLCKRCHNIKSRSERDD